MEIIFGISIVSFDKFTKLDSLISPYNLYYIMKKISPKKEQPTNDDKFSFFLGKLITKSLHEITYDEHCEEKKLFKEFLEKNKDVFQAAGINILNTHPSLTTVTGTFLSTEEYDYLLLES